MPTGDSGADQAEIPVPKSTQPVTKPPNRRPQPATRRIQRVWLSVCSLPISEGSRAPTGRLDGVVLGTWGIAALSPRLTSRSPLGTHGFGGGLRRKAKWSSFRSTPLGTHGFGECGWRNGARIFPSASSHGRRNGPAICRPGGPKARIHTSLRKAKWSRHLSSGRAKGPDPYQPGPAAQWRACVPRSRSARGRGELTWGVPSGTLTSTAGIPASSGAPACMHPHRCGCRFT